MPQFSYTARDERGRIDRGMLTAGSLQEARSQLEAKGLKIDQILEMRTAAAAPTPPLTFTPSMPWTTVNDTKEEKKTQKAIQAEATAYVPLVETFRLFAGWLLAWYGIVYMLGHLMTENKLPIYIPYLRALFESDLVLRFTFGTFLFLLLTTLHKLIGGGVGKGIAVTVVGVAVFVLFHLNA
jgi:hypothetical protein